MTNCNDEEIKKKRPTHTSISTERYKICELVFKSKGMVAQLNERYEGGTKILKYKQLLFKKTEANYQRYRNFDMLMATELIQFNESVKTNVTTYNNVYKSLNDALKNVAKSIKDLTAKVTELKGVGAKLYDCVYNDCHKTQLRALTGKAQGCADDPKPSCPEAGSILDELINKPIGFMKDANFLFKSSYEVVGIQTFSNVESLIGLQKKLDEHSKKLTKHINETSKARETDLKKLQEDVVKSVQENGKSWIELNHERSSFEGYRDAAGFLCQPPCLCTDPKYIDPADGHQGALLKKCADDICDICKIVDNSFCCRPKDPVVPEVDPNNC